VNGAERSIVSDAERFIVSNVERLQLGRSSGGNTADQLLDKPWVLGLSNGFGFESVETAV
jgi:hypothetical protein